MIADLFRGAGAALSGWRLIRTPGLRRWVWPPLLINVALFGGGLYWAWTYVAALAERLQAHLPDWLDWLTVLLWPLFWVTALLVLFYGFSLLANLIAAPFNGPLAAAVERHLTGRPPPAGQAPWWRELWQAVHGELVKLWRFALIALLLLLLSLIPGLNLLAPAAWLAFAAWTLAVEYLDYPAGNHAVAFPELRRRLRARPGLALGFGLVVGALTAIPVLNLFVIPAAVAGATRLWCERFATPPS